MGMARKCQDKVFALHCKSPTGGEVVVLCVSRPHLQSYHGYGAGSTNQRAHCEVVHRKMLSHDLNWCCVISSYDVYGQFPSGSSHLHTLVLTPLLLELVPLWWHDCGNRYPWLLLLPYQLLVSQVLCTDLYDVSTAKGEHPQRLVYWECVYRKATTKEIIEYCQEYVRVV